ncbi:unnamed protein product [Prorocentrum cordatum]|uniref:Malate dehydrogenase n=1 Tax=Prorocentrum cordatum TaxID=2364126 RepID=A0ABN9R0N1_9DINO|nr:unnamed protein product [Polarella glacialis]
MGGSPSSCAGPPPPCLAGLCGRDGAPPPREAPGGQPLRVTVVAAAGQIAYSLLPMIAGGNMFGPGQRVSLQCQDLGLAETQQAMGALEMELQDGNFPLLAQATFTTDDAIAFRAADYVLLLGAFPDRGPDRRALVENNGRIFRAIGRAVEAHASRACRVVVVGQPTCTNALLCSMAAPSLPRENFFALTRLDQNRAAGLLAARAGVPAGDVRGVVVWGCHGCLPDLDHVRIKGQPIHQALPRDEDKRWLREQFPHEFRERSASVAEARGGLPAALSAARAVVDAVRDLHLGAREYVSLGVWSDGSGYGVAGGLVCSLPVQCLGGGRWRVAPGLRLSEVQMLGEEFEDRALAQAAFGGAAAH